MAKAEPLTPDALLVPQITPKAATPARGALARGTLAVSEKPTSKPDVQKPLQVRLPSNEIKAIKIAAAEREQTISDFLLSCFHAYMGAGK